jgi:hypothetical protein
MEAREIKTLPTIRQPHPSDKPAKKIRPNHLDLRLQHPWQVLAGWVRIPEVVARRLLPTSGSRSATTVGPGKI